MKLSQALLKQALPGSGSWSTTLLKVEKGFELTLNEESRMVAVKLGDVVKLIAIENTHWVEPLPAEKPAKK